LNIKDEASTSIWPIDENVLGVDVDGDGRMGKASSVRKASHYVGDAGQIELAFQQFPVGAEIMHSVRYVGVTEDDKIIVPKRMKELRYMRTKTSGGTV
jgi:hypothetical protein